MKDKDYVEEYKKLDKSTDSEVYWFSFDDEIAYLRESMKVITANNQPDDRKVAVAIKTIQLERRMLMNYYKAFSDMDMEFLNDVLFENAHLLQMSQISDFGCDHGVFGMRVSTNLLAANMFEDLMKLLPLENGIATYSFHSTPIVNLLMAVLYDNQEFTKEAVDFAKKALAKKATQYAKLHIECMLAIVEKDYEQFNEKINLYCKAFKKNTDFFLIELGKQFVIEAHGLYNLAKWAYAGAMKEKIVIPVADNFCQELARYQDENNHVPGKIRHVYPEDLDFYNQLMVAKPVEMHLVSRGKKSFVDTDRYLAEMILENKLKICI